MICATASLTFWKAACRKGIAVLPVGFVGLGIPCARAHSLDQLGRYAITLDGQGMIGIAWVDFVDEFQIRLGILRQAGCCGERRNDLLAIQAPERLEAPDDRRN